MRITSKRTGKVIAANASIARSLTDRIKGLIGRREFRAGSALVIPGCRQVHTFFVRFPIDLVFVDKNSIVLRTQECVRPFDISRYCRTAVQTIELPAGTVSSFGIRQGDALLFEDLE